jgi:hypothetical protein
MKTSKRTIQDQEALGDKPVKGVYEVCIELLIWKDRIVMQAIKEKVAIDIARDYPNGIPSVPVVEEE